MLEELGVPYETKFWEFPNLKTPEYEKINPNGRTPTIEDPNTGITLWEASCHYINIDFGAPSNDLNSPALLLSIS